MADANSDLTEFNRRVLRWANASDCKYSRTLKLLGWAADRDTHETRKISKPRLVRLSERHAREGVPGMPVPRATLTRHITELEALGVIKVRRGKQDFTDKSRGHDKANRYWIDTSKIIEADGVVTVGYAFAAPFPGDAPDTSDTESRSVVSEPVSDGHAPCSEPEDRSEPEEETEVNLDNEPEDRSEPEGEPVSEPEDEPVSRELGFSRFSREDQKIFRVREDEPKAEPEPAPGRGRVSFSYPAFKPSAATDRNPSVDGRLTGSAASDLIHATFPDPAEQAMASEFVKLFRDHDYAKVVKAAGFFFRDKRWALGRVRNPRAYARKCAGSVRETLDGWKAQEDARRRGRERDAEEARREAEADRRAAEDAARHRAEREARGEVALDLDYQWKFDTSESVVPRDRAVQVPSKSGDRLVWVLRQDETRYRRLVLGEDIPLTVGELAKIGEGIDLGEDSPVLAADTDSGELIDGTAPGPGISIDELLGEERREDEPATGRG